MAKAKVKQRKDSKGRVLLKGESQRSRRRTANLPVRTDLIVVRAAASDLNVAVDVDAFNQPE